MTRTFQRSVLALAFSLLGTTLWAQAPPADPAKPADPAVAATAANTQAPDDPDLDPNKAQPDFYVVTMPTNLRMPRHKAAFRLTHRFGRPLGQGDFQDLLADFFGFDSGAIIGLEFRYGIIRGGQVGIYRTSDRTIQFFGQYDIKNQKTFPVGISAVANIDGTNNFSDSYSPGISAVISREISDRAAVYVQPAWINNTNPEPSEIVDDNNTAVIGLGARLRVHGSTYIVVEGSPRLSGYAPGKALVSFGIEKQAGGHMFQLNFSNGFGTSLAQVARGGTSFDDWYIGFNLSRKFF